MRDLHEVILQMLEIIPTDRKYLHDKLKAYLNCPTVTEADWNDVGDLLFQEVFTDFRPEEDWMNQLDIIWTGDEDPYELKNSNF